MTDVIYVSESSFREKQRTFGDLRMNRPSDADIRDWFCLDTGRHLSIYELFSGNLSWGVHNNVVWPEPWEHLPFFTANIDASTGNQYR